MRERQQKGYVGKRNKMKILYITAEGFDTPNQNNQMAEVLIRSFLDNGHKVHLIQSHKKGINPDVPFSLLDREGFTVDTVVRKVVDKTRFVKRYINDFKYAFSAMRYWKKVKDADVIYLQSNPTILYPMLLLRLFKHKVPIVYSIYDVFPGHAYDIGVIKSKLIFNTLKILQKPCYKMARAIIVLSTDMKDKVVKQGAKREKVYVVPAWYDVETAKEIAIEDNKFIKKYNIPTDKFYIQFAGTIGYVFNYHTVIELAKRLKNEPNIMIQIVGEGNVKDRFIKEAQEAHLDNISFYPLQPVDIVPDVYSACNLCVIPLMKGVIGNGVPSKVPILMACKRVVVSSVESDSDYARMFAQNRMGIAVDITDYDSLAEAVVRLYHSPEELKLMANNAYNYGKENYSSTKSIHILLQVLEGCTKQK